MKKKSTASSQIQESRMRDIDGESRSKWVHVKCSETERLNWKAEAEAADLTVADLIRRRMATKLEGREPVRKRPTRRVDPELIRSVGRVGSNLNQIAKWLNTHGSAVEVTQVLAVLISIDEQITRSSDPGTSSSYRPSSRSSSGVTDVE